MCGRIFSDRTDDRGGAGADETGSGGGPHGWEPYDGACESREGGG